jgi:voltage-gated sodium channel
VILALRLLRILRIFRVFKFFPNINQITKGFIRALKQSRAILIGFIIIIIISGLINCCLFKNIAPEYFSTPLNSIYTVFRIFTVEGWYEIPDAIALATTPLIGKIARLYFCLLLCGGGIIGLSFVNSVFVDAMVEDNNDDIKEQLNRIEKKLDELENRN